ncbi:MAG: hypothetical protein AUJ12_09055 [Alphaproteobacteria bacterium CG1_02_46_17]|nr:MAG: hypothetical protein AUJ12_09055 [Alphaproteobacteria bacterium CG1_02_46_17]
MNTTTTSTLMDSIKRAINSTEEFAQSSNSRSGVFRIRTHFMDALGAEDPIKILKRARNEANFAHNKMMEEGSKNPDSREVVAFATLCETLNSIEPCAVTFR